MAVVTGVMSSATPALALYNLIAAALTANPNWSRPVDPTLTGGTDSYAATATSEVWKCTVGSNSFHVVFSTDTASPNNLRITYAEKYGAADGCAAKRFRRTPAGGATGSTGDNTSVTPGATDVVTDADTALISTSPNFAYAQLVLTGSAFPYMFKVTNKTVTVGVVVTNNKWIHVGGFESLVTGPSDPVPVALFTHGLNNPAVASAAPSTVMHACGTTTRNPGLGTTAESGAFFVGLRPLHAPGLAFTIGSSEVAQTASVLGFGATPPRWYTKVLVSQAVIHQSRAAGGGSAVQSFRGYYSDLFACIISGTTEPQGGGIDSVVIDGVTYYWLGVNCPGNALAAVTSGVSVLVAIRAD